MTKPTSWLELGAITLKTVKGNSAENQRARRVINEFCDYATKSGLPFPAVLADDAAQLDAFSATLEHYRNDKGELNRNGTKAVEWASELMRLSRRAVEPEPEVTNPQPEEDDMAKRGEEEDQLEETGEEELDEGGDEEEYEEEEEAPPKKKRAAPRSVQPQVVVQLPPGLGRQQNRAAPKAEPRRKRLIERPQSIRIYKRDERGKVVEVDEYTEKDLAGRDVKSFIEEVIHPRVSNEGMDTEYLVYEVDGNGNERGNPVEFIIESDELPPQASNDPFGQVTRAVQFVKQLKGDDEKPQPNPVLQQLGSKAAQNNDMMGVMLAMMLERVMAPKANADEALVLKVLERLGIDKKTEAPPPPWMQPGWGPPSPPPATDTASSKLLDLALAKLAQGGPNLIDQMKEMAMLQQMLGPKESPDVAALKAELATLRSMLATKPKGGLEAEVESFEKVTTLVKSLAPTIGSEQGFAGFLKGILTPQVGAAVRDAVTSLTQGQQQAQQAQQPGTLPAPQAAPAQPPPRNPKQPPNPAPQHVIDAAKGIALAQTELARAERFADFIIAMATANDPYYNELLQPAVSALQKEVVGVEELKVVRRLGMGLVLEQNVNWATPEFVDAILAALAAKVGIAVPPALAQTRGAWLADMRGNIVMLQQLGAQPVAPQQPVAQAKPQAPVPVPPGFGVDAPPAQPLSTPPPERKLRKVELEPEDTAVPTPKPTPSVEVTVVEPEPKQLQEDTSVSLAPPSEAVIDMQPSA